jgi:hypothetical protein
MVVVWVRVGVTVLQTVLVIVVIGAGRVVVAPLVMPKHEHADEYAGALLQQLA